MTEPSVVAEDWTKSWYAFLMLEPLRRGLVGWKTPTLPSHESPETTLKATSEIVVSEVASSECLSKNFIPWLSAQAQISGSSEEITMRSAQPESWTALTVWTNKGTPPIVRTFLRITPLLPLRAGIIARSFPRFAIKIKVYQYEPLLSWCYWLSDH